MHVRFICAPAAGGIQPDTSGPTVVGRDPVPAPPPTSQAAPDTEPMGETLDQVVVTAQLLNEKRAGIQTQTGASSYTIDDAAIAATPGGNNTLLSW